MIFFLFFLENRIWHKLSPKKIGFDTNCLLRTTLWANSADNKLMIFFFLFPERRIWFFMQTVSNGDNLHEMSDHVSGVEYKKYFSMFLLKILPRVLNVDSAEQIVAHEPLVFCCNQYKKLILFSVLPFTDFLIISASQMCFWKNSRQNCCLIFCNER